MDLSPASIAERMQAVAVRGRVSPGWRRLVTALFDVCIIAAAAALAFVGRTWIPAAEPDAALADRALTYTPWIALAWLAMLVVCGAYQDRALSVGIDEYQRVLLASGLTAGGLAIYLYLAEVQLSRSYYLLLFCFGVPAILCGRRVMRFAEHRLHLSGRVSRRVLLVGAGSHLTDALTVIQRERWLGLRAVVAATQCKPEIKSADANGKRDIPAVLQALHD